MYSMSRITNGGTIQLSELIPFLYKCCKSQAKGVFANLINKLTLSEVTYCQVSSVAPQQNILKPSLTMQQAMQIQAQRHFICFKIFSLLAFSKLDLNALALKTELREIQLDLVILRLEEQLEIKLMPKELALFKKEFDSFFLVPQKILEAKMNFYIGTISAYNLVQE